MDFFIRLGKHVNHGERMNPIDFGGQRSKVKVIMDIYGNKLGNHALPNIFLSFCPSLSPVDTLDVITLK